MTFYREATLEAMPGAIGTDQDCRAKLSFSSEKAVLRQDKNGPYWEVLSHAAGDAKLGLLNRQGVVLRNHDDRQVIGEVVRGSAKVDGDRKCRCTIEVYPEEADLLDGMRSGKLPNKVSVGYNRLSVLSQSVGANGVRVLRFSWEPYEVSALDGLEAADDGVGLNRSKPTIITMNEENDSVENEPGMTRSERRAGLQADYRAKNINAAVNNIVEHHPQIAGELRQMASEAILTRTDPEEFNARLMAKIRSAPSRSQFMQVEDSYIGMSPQEVHRWSLLRAIQQFERYGRLVEGIEKEASDAFEKKNRMAPTGFWWPTDCTMPLNNGGRRDLNVTTFGQGGAFVQTSVFSTPIEILRNRLVTQRLGVKTMGGLAGNVALPRQTGAATAYALPESATLTKSTQAIDQVLLTPKKVGAYNEYTKQLLLQSTVDVENFIRDDLMKVLAVKWDKLILEGAGSGSEPTGILNTNGIGSVTFGGAASWSSIVSFETALASVNADVGNRAFVTTPSVRAKWKAIPKVGSTFPIFLWEDGEWNDSSDDGTVNGYRAAVTNQLSNNAVAFANWGDAIHALWGGFDVVVNPYARDIDAVVRITVNSFGDVAARHAASFVWSADSGAQ